MPQTHGLMPRREWHSVHVALLRWLACNTFSLSHVAHPTGCPCHCALSKLLSVGAPVSKCWAVCFVSHFSQGVRQTHGTIHPHPLIISPLSRERHLGPPRIHLDRLKTVSRENGGCRQLGYTLRRGPVFARSPPFGSGGGRLILAHTKAPCLA